MVSFDLTMLYEWEKYPESILIRILQTVCPKTNVSEATGSGIFSNRNLSNEKI